MKRYLAGPSRNTTEVNTQQIASGRDERRHGDARRTVQRRLSKRHLLLGQQPMRVLDRDRGVVDQDADRKRQAAKRHGVQRVAEEIERDQRREDGERNRDHDDQRRPPRAQEQQDHQRGQSAGDHAFAHHALDRIGDEGRLIEQLADVQPGGSRGARSIKRRLHAPHHVERRGIAVLDHGQQNGAQAVLAHDVLLHGIGIAHLADILHEHRGPVGKFQRDVVQVGDGGGDRVGFDGVLLVADLRRAGGQRQILRVDRVHHVERGQPLGEQLRRVEIDHDLPVFAASRRRKRDAVDRRQLLAQAIDAVIVKLLLVERVRGQRELQHRHAGGVELHDDRRLDAGRHQRADSVGRGNDLRDGKVEIDVGLEVDLLHRDAVERLRLHVLDAGDVRADRVLAVGRDALLHLRRRQPGVAPDHRHHRNVDLREDVGRHGADRRHAEKHDQRGEHIEGVRKSEREPDDSHCLVPGLESAAS